MFLLFRAFPFGCCPEVGLDDVCVHQDVRVRTVELDRNRPKEKVAGVLAVRVGDHGGGRNSPAGGKRGFPKKRTRGKKIKSQL